MINLATGHIHKLDYNTYENQRIVYPGLTISLGFDELGEHGMIVGEVDKNAVNLSFVPLNETEFIEIELDITDIISKEELIEKLNDLEIDEKSFAKIILIGKRNFEINRYELYKIIDNNRIIKIKDKTKINYNLEKISKENTLKGIFAREMLERLNNENMSDEEIEVIEKSIEIAFEALE